MTVREIRKKILYKIVTVMKLYVLLTKKKKKNVVIRPGINSDRKTKWCEENVII